MGYWDDRYIGWLAEYKSGFMGGLPLSIGLSEDDDIVGMETALRRVAKETGASLRRLPTRPPTKPRRKKR